MARRSYRLRPATRAVIKENVAGYLFVLPWLVGFLVFRLSPIISSMYLSFTKYDILRPAVWIGFDNYRTLFTDDPLFYKSLTNTLFYSALFVPFSVTGSLLLAVLLNNKLRGMGVYKTMFYIPSVTTGVALALLWLWLFDPGMGVINMAIRAFGLKAPLWFRSEALAKPTMVLVGLVNVGGPRMIVFLAALQGLPEDLYEAADLDGASWFYKLRRITVPLISPVILFNIIITIIGSFRVFINAYVVTEGGPLNATLFIVLYIYRNAFRWLRMGYASALAWIFFMIVLVITVIQLALSGRWVYYSSGDKG